MANFKESNQKCSLCDEKPVIYMAYAQQSLCKNHFIFSLEKRVKRTIRDHGLLKKVKHIGIGVSGGKDSVTLLHLLNKVAKPMKIKLTAIIIDEGIKGYREEEAKDAEKICNNLGIELKRFSYKDKHKISMDELMVSPKKKLTSCSYCGVFRRWSLNEASKELGVDRLAIGHNLDDTVQSYMMNILRNEPFRLARFGPISGIVDDDGFVPRIKPLFKIPEKEIALYSILMGFKTEFAECPYVHEAFRPVVREFINNLESKYPGTKFKILNNYSATQKALENEFKKTVSDNPVKYCSNCNEPSSADLCKRCQFLDQLTSPN